MTASGNPFGCLHHEKGSALGGGEVHSTAPKETLYLKHYGNPWKCVHAGGGRRLHEVCSSTPPHLPVRLKVISKGLLSSLNVHMLESFTFSFDGGNGFRIAPVSYSTASHRSHLFKSDSELV